MMPMGAAGALYAMANLLTREWCAGEPVGALLGGLFPGDRARRSRRLGAAHSAAGARRGAGGHAVPDPPLGRAIGCGAFWVAAQAVGSLVAVGLNHPRAKPARIPITYASIPSRRVGIATALVEEIKQRLRAWG